MTKFRNKTVLITGGASGIGLLLTKFSIEKGASALIILDIDKPALQQVELQLKTNICQILSFETDLSNEIQIENAVKKITAQNLQVDILINNAGVVTGKNFSEHNLEDIDRNMQVNAIAPMKLTKLLLPEMLKRKSGHIVNISSAASMLSNPGMSVYCASKWAMTGWSDSLRLEMERERTGIKVLTVTPYYIDTGMFEGVKSPVIPILKPEKVAWKIIRSIDKNKIVLRTPKIIYTLPLMQGLFPKRLLDLIIGKFFGIYNSMDKFKGRTHE
ncbi:SDR family oxidoreductase [Christiangramia forsetii]|uniref:Short-chain dehydrogenase/reductase family protein n=2 Tax=Christiangramia forsetii TaxID=411153 RepID=A0LZZ5_CHRFK|nr:SDR family oxidoreductase [Christiangramia forsetii]GGG45682.1 oxidoreductase [Christiangramia forsetii]CAL65940.1 short-chain dehydrogenase/reductase family protein [Christiangramia forsetii KT0803]